MNHSENEENQTLILVDFNRNRAKVNAIDLLLREIKNEFNNHGITA